MYDFEKFEKLIEERLSPYRYTHSMNVAKKARELAVHYGVDADKAYLAGVLHDITKETDYDLQEKYIIKSGHCITPLEKNNKKVYHQISGMAFVQQELGINDEQILNGIRFHTTGCENMSIFEMIIYLADLTSEERNYPDVDKMRKLTDTSLLEAMHYALSFVIKDLVNKSCTIHPDTIFCYNWVMEQKNKEKLL